jgi:hypothetical protein
VVLPAVAVDSVLVVAPLVVVVLPVAAVDSVLPVVVASVVVASVVVAAAAASLVVAALLVAAAASAVVAIDPMYCLFMAFGGSGSFFRNIFPSSCASCAMAT